MVKLANDVPHFQMGNVCHGLLYAFALCQSLGVGCYRTVRLSNDLYHFQMGNVCIGHFV